MKRLLTVGLVTLLVACGGVDKDKTGDNFIDSLEDQGFTFTDEQKDCIKDAVKSYSDEDLTALSDEKASDELTADFQSSVSACVP